MTNGILSPPSNIKPAGLNDVDITQNLNQQIPLDLAFPRRNRQAGAGWAITSARSR